MALDGGKETAWIGADTSYGGDGMSTFPVEQEGGSKDREEGIRGWEGRKELKTVIHECRRLNEQGKYGGIARQY